MSLPGVGAAGWERAALSEFSEPGMYKPRRERGAGLNPKRPQLFRVLRSAVSGKRATPPLFGMINALGRELTLERLDRAIARLQTG